jgi:hypothetical protein
MDFTQVHLHRKIRRQQLTFLLKVATQNTNNDNFTAVRTSDLAH